MTVESRTGLVEVAPNAWAVVMSLIPPEGGGPNAGFVLAGGQVVVIDSLLSPGFGQQLAEYVRRVTDRPVAYLINTHAHGDHVFGNQVFAPAARVVAQRKVRDTLLSQGESMVKSFAERFADMVPDIKDAEVVPPDITYCRHMTLHFDDRTIELIHPGVAHTDGDTMVYLPEDRLLYAGDLLFNHIFPPIMGSSAGWIAAIEQIEAMDVDAIVPGHGFVATKKELGDLKQCITEVRHQVKQCFNRGLPVEETVKQVDLPYLHWPRAERLPVAVQTIYRELTSERP